MSDQDERKLLTDRDDPGPTSDAVETEPRGNPDTDQEAVDKGLEQLDRL